MKTLIIALALLPLAAFAQDSKDDKDPYGKLTVTGSIQSDILIPSEITGDMKEHFTTNTYIDLRAISRHVEGGLRFEYLDHPLPGFESQFKGLGVPNIYIKLNYDKWNLTLGSFYEQFGSGFILRAYEERSLGVDNSLLGARINFTPFKGATFKILTGTQRVYWDISRSLISGADVELRLDEWIPKMAAKGTYLTAGFSWVNKYEDPDRETIMYDATHRLNSPKFVNAWDARLNLQTHGFNILAEYARKTQDPNFNNGFIFHPGNVAMLSASYSKKGLSALVQAKRSENMSFRSNRNNGTLISGFINHLPAFTLDHTYSLAALYPYATQLDGEWALQAEFGYKFKKGTALGGKYGTNIKVNASYVRPLNPIYTEHDLATHEGYTTNFFQWGDYELYRDINVQIEKKFSKVFKLNFMYMNQLYNKGVIEKHGDIVHSNIFVLDGKFQLSKKTALRAEAQYLLTKDDEKDWIFGLLELSIAPHWMLTVSDMYNLGSTKEHYYQGSVTFSYNAHRLQAGFGRTRAGFNCTGGVCRRVPETKGVTINYNYNF